MNRLPRVLPPLLLVVYFLTGCQLEGGQPAEMPAPVLLTQVKTSLGDERQFVYNAQGWLTTVTGKGSLALSKNLQSNSSVLFDSWNRVAYLVTVGTPTSAENVYHYTSDHMLYKLEELVQGRIEQYHTFEYDANKFLKVRYSFLKDPSAPAGVPQETEKRVYSYDANGNVAQVLVYQKAAADQNWQLAQTQIYEDYDANVGVQHMEDPLFTPCILVQRNNPGKVTTLWPTGERQVTRFTYLYNDRNLPVKRTSTPDQGPSFETVFSYQL